MSDNRMRVCLYNITFLLVQSGREKIHLSTSDLICFIRSGGRISRWITCRFSRGMIYFEYIPSLMMQIPDVLQGSVQWQNVRWASDIRRNRTGSCWFFSLCVEITKQETKHEIKRRRASWSRPHISTVSYCFPFIGKKKGLDEPGSNKDPLRQDNKNNEVHLFHLSWLYLLKVMWNDVF